MFHVNKAFSIDRKDVVDYQYKQWYIIRIAEEDDGKSITFYTAVVEDPIDDAPISILESFRANSFEEAHDRFIGYQTKYYNRIIKQFIKEEWRNLWKKF